MAFPFANGACTLLQVMVVYSVHQPRLHNGLHPLILSYRLVLVDRVCIRAQSYTGIGNAASRD